MKKLFLSMLLGCALIGNAETTTMNYSYIDGVEDFFGLGPNYKINVYDVAILLPGDVFEGCSIKDISMPVRNISGINNYGVSKVWLSSKLSLSNGENDPDLGSYDASISMVGDQAVLSGTLPESYVIGENGVYVGVSLGVLASDDSTDYPVSIGYSDSKDSFWIHIPSSQSYLRWINGHTKYGYGCGISVSIDNVPSHAVRIVDIPSAIYTALNAPVVIDMELSAVGSQAVSSVDIEYEISGMPHSYHYVLPEALPAGIDKRFTVSLEIPAQSVLLNENVAFKVTKVNGELNPVSDATAKSQLRVFEEMPVRQTLFEEYTCTKCTWCPRGFASIEYISKNYPDWVVASYHNSYQGPDPMDVVSKLPSSISGNPSAYLNRVEEMDPFYGTERYMNYKVPIVGDILELNKIPTVWKISASHEWESDNTLVAKAEVTNMIGYENESYTIAYLLVADGLSGVTSPWKQTNGYASYAPDSNNPDELNAFCRGGVYGKSSVEGLVFNDVVISGDGIHGVKDSMPISLAAAETTTHSLKFDLSKIRSELIPDRNKLRVIAAVLDNKGRVLNCAKNEVNDYVDSAVEGIECDENAPVEFYNLNGVKVAQPTEGLYIRRQGSKSEKVIIR